MLVIGSAFYPARGDAARRQERARAALLALSGAIPINLQFEDERFDLDGVRMVPVLRLDSRTVTGAAGRRKPIVSEMLDALASIATEAKAPYFTYINADIEVTQAAVDYIASERRDGYAFCRVDVDPETREDFGIQPYGVDMIAIRTDWWARERRRFRPYIAGEACWDNVYAALLCSYGNGDLVDHRKLIFHERHPAVWIDSPFAAYNGHLAGLDARYFSQWVTYVDAARRGRGADADHERLVREVLGNPRLSWSAHIRNAARQIRARWRYARRARQ